VTLLSVGCANIIEDPTPNNKKMRKKIERNNIVLFPLTIDLLGIISI
jgi:hypothetical protein